MIRVRALAVIPQSNKNRVRLGDKNGPILEGSRLHVSSSVVPEVDITYFFTKNFALETICCVTPHRVKARGTIEELGRVGKMILFPPTLMAQYHFTDLGQLKPYVGVGVNYTVYFRERSGKAFNNFDLRNTWGVVGQIGFDYMIDKHWGINFDVKKYYMRPKARVNLADVPLYSKVKVDPWLISTGVVYKF